MTQICFKTGVSMHNLTITFVRRESNASLRLNIRLRSLIFAARRCDTVATLRRFLEGREALKEFISFCIFCTGRMGWMAHRKWKEIKQQPGTAGQGNMLGCCLLSFHFLWAIHPIRPVQKLEYAIFCETNVVSS